MRSESLIRNCTSCTEVRGAKPAVIGKLVNIIVFKRKETCGDELEEPMFIVGRIKLYQRDGETFSFIMEGSSEMRSIRLHTHRVEIWEQTNAD